MAEENKGVVTQEQGADTQEQGGTENETPPEKKYTDEDVNNISAKNSKKALAKLMKELGINENTDRAAVKKLIEESAIGAAAESKNNDSQTSQLSEALAQARETAENAVLENILLSSHVKVEKVQRAAKLIDRKDCLDDEGNFSREKAQSAATELLKDWPELVEKNDDSKVGFTIGSDGQQDSKKQPEKGKAQKSWNKFNY